VDKLNHGILPQCEGGAVLDRSDLVKYTGDRGAQLEHGMILVAIFFLFLGNVRAPSSSRSPYLSADVCIYLPRLEPHPANLLSLVRWTSHVWMDRW